MPISPFRRFVGNSPTVWRASDQTLPPGVVFTRTGAALYLSGLTFATSDYVSVASDLPRFERLPSGGIGWLGEGQATNVNPYSYDLTNGSGWNLVGTATRTLNQPGLTGSANTATVVTDSNAAARDGVGIFGITIATAASTILQRHYILKDATTTRFPEADTYLTANQVWEEFNTSTGATFDKGAGGSIAPTMYSRDRGKWWEVGYYGTKPSGDTSINYQLLPAGGATLGGTDNSATGSVTVGGIEFMIGTIVPTSPIQTNSVADTRSAELASQTTGLPPGYGFSVAFTARTAPIKSGNQYLWSIDDGTSANFIQIRRTSGGVITLDVTAGSVAQASITAGTIADDTEFKVAATIATNSMNICTGTTLGTRDTSCTIPTGLTTIRYFTDQANANHWNGHIISGKFGPVWMPQANDAGLLALCA